MKVKATIRKSSADKKEPPRNTDPVKSYRDSLNAYNAVNIKK